MVGKEAVEFCVGKSLANEVFVAFARGMEDYLHVGRYGEGELCEGVGVGRCGLEGRDAAVAHHSDVGESGLAERLGHIVVVDDEGGARGKVLHGAELGGACGEAAVGGWEEASVAVGMYVGVAAKGEEVVGYLVNAAEDEFVVAAYAHA